jgi:hypothetical protein
MAPYPEQRQGSNYEEVGRMVAPGAKRSSGRIYTVVGALLGGWVSSGDGGRALWARIAAMFVAMDGAGNLVLVDACAEQSGS